MSSSIPSWQILTAHAQPFRRARDLAFCLKVLLDSLLVWASSGGSGESARMRRLAWTFAARIGDKYQIRLTRPICINGCRDYNSKVISYLNYFTCMQSQPDTVVMWVKNCWKRRKTQQQHARSYIGAASWENLFIPYANNKGANQPANSRSLISAFVVRCLDSVISLLAIDKI